MLVYLPTSVFFNRNKAHKDFKRIKIKSISKFEFDPRIKK